MAVYYYWNRKRGEIIMKEEETGKRYKLGLFGGNTLFSIIYRYRKVNEKTGKLTGYHNFILWFDDEKQLKRVLEDDKNFFNEMIASKSKVLKFKLNITSKNEYANKEMLKVANILTRSGYKVELY